MDRIIAACLLALIPLTLYTKTNAVAEETKILTLDEAIEHALSKNPLLEASRKMITIREAKVTDAKSDLYPHVRFKFILPFVERESGIFADQLIWDFGRTPNLIKFSKANLRASKLDLSADASQIVLDTKIAYYTALTEKHDFEAKRKLVESKLKRLEQLENFLQTGRATKLEVARAKVDLGNARLEMLTAQANFKKAKIELAKAMGMEGEFEYELEDMLDYKPVDVDLDAAVKSALEKRPEMKSLEEREEGLQASARASLQSFYPTILGRVAYRFEGEGATGPDFIGGLGLVMPIFDGFSKYSGVKESRAMLSRARSEMDTLRQRIISEVKEAYLDLTLAEEAVSVARDSMASAQDNYGLVSEVYKMGKTSLVELTEAEALKEDTGANYIRAIYNYKIAVARLERAIGESIE
jgi:outer membrane protein TolC